MNKKLANKSKNRKDYFHTTVALRLNSMCFINKFSTQACCSRNINSRYSIPFRREYAQPYGFSRFLDQFSAVGFLLGATKRPVCFQTGVQG